MGCKRKPSSCPHCSDPHLNYPLHLTAHLEHLTAHLNPAADLPAADLPDADLPADLRGLASVGQLVPPSHVSGSVFEASQPQGVFISAPLNYVGNQKLW